MDHVEADVNPCILTALLGGQHTDWAGDNQHGADSGKTSNMGKGNKALSATWTWRDWRWQQLINHIQ